MKISHNQTRVYSTVTFPYSLKDSLNVSNVLLWSGGIYENVKIKGNPSQTSKDQLDVSGAESHEAEDETTERHESSMYGKAIIGFVCSVMGTW